MTTKALGFGLCLAAAMTGWQSPATAQERLPWEPPAAAQSYGADPYRPKSDADRYSDVYDPPPQNGSAIRQPAVRPRYEAPRDNRAAQPYDRNYGDPGARASRPYGERRYGNNARPPYANPPRGRYDAPAYDGQLNDGRGYGERAYQDRGYDDGRSGNTFSIDEITAAGHGFFGSISKGLASVIEYAFKRSGRPNGYILGEGASGAFIAGLRYGEGRLYTKSAGSYRVYWQGPTIGYDAGADGSKTMVLVYNLRDPSDIYHRFGGINGSAYLVGGVGITFQKHKHVILAPIRAGVGLRLGANIGYLKYTRRPTWNPF